MGLQELSKAVNTGHCGHHSFRELPGVKADSWHLILGINQPQANPWQRKVLFPYLLLGQMASSIYISGRSRRSCCSFQSLIPLAANFISWGKESTSSQLFTLDSRWHSRTQRGLYTLYLCKAFGLTIHKKFKVFISSHRCQTAKGEPRIPRDMKIVF